MRLPASAGASGAAEGEIRQLTSDLFHELSQPLTNLCCSLELSLLQSPTTEEYGQIVSQALLQAEKASGLATAIRELLDAGHAGEKAEVLDLSRAISDAAGDLLPVAESAGVNLDYFPGSECPVWFDAHRLRQGLFHLLGSFIGMGGPGSVLRMDLETTGTEIGLDLTVSGVSDSNRTSAPQSELMQRLELGISRSIFEAAGATFTLKRGSRSIQVRVCLPGVGAQFRKTIISASS